MKLSHFWDTKPLENVAKASLTFSSSTLHFRLVPPPPVASFSAFRGGALKAAHSSRRGVTQRFMDAEGKGSEEQQRKQNNNWGKMMRGWKLHSHPVIRVCHAEEITGRGSH